MPFGAECLPDLPGNRLDIPLGLEHTGSWKRHKPGNDHENASTPAFAALHGNNKEKCYRRQSFPCRAICPNWARNWCISGTLC